MQYRKVNTIFSASLIEGITTKEKAIYVNEARKGRFLTVLTNPPTPSRSISFSNVDAMVVRFPHNDSLIITMIIDNCQASKILVNKESSVNILYGDALDRMKDTPELPE